MTVTKNLEISRNTTKGLKLVFKKNGLPHDITGWTIYFTVKENMEDSEEDAEIAKDVTSHIDATNGKTVILLDPSDTNIKGNYYYDIKWKDTDGNSNIVLRGRIKFQETVTTRG